MGVRGAGVDLNYAWEVRHRRAMSIPALEPSAGGRGPASARLSLREIALNTWIARHAVDYEAVSKIERIYFRDR